MPSPGFSQGAKQEEFPAIRGPTTTEQYMGVENKMGSVQSLIANENEPRCSFSALLIGARHKHFKLLFFCLLFSASSSKWSSTCPDFPFFPHLNVHQVPVSLLCVFAVNTGDSPVIWGQEQLRLGSQLE